jgi:hypothetical protein
MQTNKEESNKQIVAACLIMVGRWDAYQKIFFLIYFCGVKKHTK